MKRAFQLVSFSLVIAAFGSSLFALQGPVTLDRIAVVVGQHVIKTSDIARELHLNQFLNLQAPDESLNARRAAVARLIDQELIRQEIQIAGYSSPSLDDAKQMLAQIEQQRFGGSAARAQAERAVRGITQEQLLAQLRWQLMVLQFIEKRFRPGVLVNDEEIRAYYDEHLAVLNPGQNTFAAMESKIRASIEGERVNTNFEDWLKQAHQDTRVDYLMKELEPESAKDSATSAKPGSAKAAPKQATKRPAVRAPANVPLNKDSK